MDINKFLESLTSDEKTQLRFALTKSKCSITPINDRVLSGVSPRLRNTINVIIFHNPTIKYLEQISRNMLLKVNNCGTKTVNEFLKLIEID